MANGPVLVVDFGAQYAQLIARRVREAGVYSELVPHSMPVDEILAKDPKAIILSGGPASVFEPGAPTIDTKVFESGVPVLGICYGFQVMAYELGGKVDKAALGEYGKTSAAIGDADGILADSPAEQTTWMSHGVAVEQAPAGFEVLAHTEGAPVAAMADESRKLYGVQWHPEVKHSPLGQKLIENFLHRCAALPNDWDASSIIEDQVKKIREQVGDAEVICGLSGGVDSAVAAALVHKAIGDQLTCVFVDHGLLRKGEVEQVKHDFVAATGIRLITVDAADDFLDALAGVSEPERKRKIIGEKFIRTFEKAQRQVLEEAGARGKEVKFLVQGTLYPDVVESGGGDGAANIKSHHNVGGLPEDLKFELVEPLRTLFKDEVRAIGTELGLPDEIVWRQPFPGPGLGIRIVGEITRERLAVLREADAIAREELTRAGLDRDIWQCPVVLLADVHSVGVQGDERTYGSPIVLRPVSSEDAMTADWSRLPYDVLATISTRITNECRQINRVVLDCTSKPPATIEWE
ncbi:glutamine-hydrolyzing GMP synthase [Bifidobacterium longum]|uniref:GMP synthase [glutamine-hydrolyzing] n=1 Tax=Bifidobacterium longum TaxID=216816 RepID=A0A6N2U3V9_BIFLN|nr:glutamine-hydrolyzing GMP synthase [Bifidobacterium longum]GDZ75037.1 GMP synthase [glutamine-hydrolyzing] [Bifidobacteriaceae bacterium MCC01989]MBS6133353.1 glutamine-hydrolyzing GMP synthase [Bifidobacterium longum]MBS6515312.1 glutamine-hydrolyzing GMP synthase [Bifidobacterium longum]MDU6622608.1 glutamine-hydrolyzing GMP synthase [Bifidobacterium longum]MDW3125770.1 glutamine-hydrolyzing GMP synthase [Bifidobacterium longum]